MDRRSAGIDYLRAVSILWVLGYHTVSLPMYKKGVYGVLLFFIISGYCIAISARHSNSAWHFYAKRLGRLLPALIVCSIITVVMKFAFPSLVEGGRIVSWRDLLLTWIDLPTAGFITGPDQFPDGAYWTLLVEFKFYLTIAAIILLGLRRYMVPATCTYVILVLAARSFVDARDVDFCAFFIAGLSVAAWHAGNRGQALFGLVFAAAFDAYVQFSGWVQPSVPIEPSRSVMLWVGTAALFAATSIPLPSIVLRLLKPLAYVGVVSYPLYLLHQDLSHMLLTSIGVTYSDSYYARTVALILVPAVFIPIAGIIHAVVERPTIEPLTNLLRGSRAKPLRSAVAS